MCKTTKYIHIYLYCYCSVSQSCSTLCNCSTIYIYTYIHTVIDFSSGSDGKKICLQCRSGFDPWVGKIPWRKAQEHTPVFLPREFHGQKSLVGYSPQGHTELDITEATQHTYIHKRKEHKNPISLLQICPESSVHCSTLQIVPDHCLWAYVITFT